MNKNILDKIIEYYIQDRIHQANQKLYIYFHSAGGDEKLGTIEANDERDLYIQLFNKYALGHIRYLMNDHPSNPLLNKKLNEIHSDEIRDMLEQSKSNPISLNNLETGGISYEVENAIISIGFSEDDAEQKALDDMKYEYMKKLIFNRDALPMSGDLYPGVCIKHFDNVE